MNADIKIVKIKDSELSQVAHLIKKCVRDSWGDIFSDKLLKEFYKKYRLDNFKRDSKNIKYLIAKDGKRIIGVLGLSGNVLENFFVEIAYQGKGIGKKLYYAIEDMAKKKHLDKIVLEASVVAVDIYKSLGFEEIKKVCKTRNGESYTNMVMMKRLTKRSF